MILALLMVGIAQPSALVFAQQEDQEHEGASGGFVESSEGVDTAYGGAMYPGYVEDLEGHVQRLQSEVSDLRRAATVRPIEQCAMEFYEMARQQEDRLRAQQRFIHERLSSGLRQQVAAARRFARHFSTSEQVRDLGIEFMQAQNAAVHAVQNAGINPRSDQGRSRVLELMASALPHGTSETARQIRQLRSQFEHYWCPPGTRALSKTTQPDVREGRLPIEGVNASVPSLRDVTRMLFDEDRAERHRTVPTCSPGNERPSSVSYVTLDYDPTTMDPVLSTCTAYRHGAGGSREYMMSCTPIMRQSNGSNGLMVAGTSPRGSLNHAIPGYVQQSWVQAVSRTMDSEGVADPTASRERVVRETSRRFRRTSCGGYTNEFARLMNSHRPVVSGSRDGRFLGEYASYRAQVREVYGVSASGGASTPVAPASGGTSASDAPVLIEERR